MGLFCFNCGWPTTEWGDRSTIDGTPSTRPRTHIHYTGMGASNDTLSFLVKTCLLVTWGEPVKMILSTSGQATSAAPASPRPVTT